MRKVNSEAEGLGYTQRYPATCVQRITENIVPKESIVSIRELVLQILGD